MVGMAGSERSVKIELDTHRQEMVNAFCPHFPPLPPKTFIIFTINHQDFIRIHFPPTVIIIKIHLSYFLVEDTFSGHWTTWS